MKHILLALLIALATYEPAMAQEPLTPVQQAQQEAANAQTAAEVATQQAAAAQQAAAEAAARAQQSVANAAAAKSQAELAQLKAQALESQQAAVAAQAAQTQAAAAMSEAQAASAAAITAAAQAQRAAAQSQALQVMALTAQARAVSVEAEARANALAQQIMIETLANQSARLKTALTYEREQAILFRVVVGLLCIAVVSTAALALVVYRRLRALSVVVVETHHSSTRNTSPIESRLPTRVRIVTDPQVVERLDALFQGDE